MLLDVAAAVGFDRAAFAAVFDGTDPQQHIDATQRLMSRAGAAGVIARVAQDH